MQKFPNHFHNHYVIGFIESGKRHLSCKNKDYIIEPGDLMLFNPRDNHACEQVGGWALDYRCINIKEEVMKGLIDEICGKEYLPEFFQTVVFHCEYVPLLKEVHELIIKESVDFEKEEKLLFLIEPLIDKYANLICESYQDNNKFITKVCDFIEKNYFKAIKLDELSEIADMNKYSLLRAFTKTRGITPYQYLQTIRIDKAKGFLEDGQEVIDVALKTGFTDQSHFTNFFKKFIGITPGQYRDIFKEHYGDYMKSDKILNGHLSALLTIIIWGTTFISTKILLKIFSPVEILFLRFSIGFITLLMVYPHKLKIKEKKEEIYFLSAGLCGVTLYFLFENIALIYTQASNVGVIISIAPFFTAILVHLILKNEELTKQFIIGFIAAIIGIILISFNGSFILKMNPIGDILAILAAIMWAFYSVITKKISSFGYNVIQTTRRIFFYGLLFMIPVLFVSKIEIHLQEFYNLSVIFNLGYLGFGASALCFVTWNFSVKVLCAVKTSVYIYLVPVITVVTSIIILNEEITIVSAFGIALILTGLIISERKFNIKKDGYKGNEICNDD